MVRNAIIAGFALALLAMNVFVCTQFGILTSEVHGLRNEFEELKKTTHTEISVLKDKTVTTHRTSQSASKTIVALQDQLAQAREQAKVEVGQAKLEATARAEQIARELAAQVSAEQQKKFDQSDQQLKTELSKVQQATSTADAKISAVHTEVTSVKTQMAADKSRIEGQTTDLKRVIGELGIQTDRIATNKRELDALKALGERNYHEFTLARGDDSIKIHDIRVALKRTDPKRSRFTVELTTADRRFQKKDRNVNEPIQFYVNKTRQPSELVVNELYELVVNQVDKDSIKGYLSTPKVQVSTNGQVPPVSQAHVALRPEGAHQ